MSGLRVLELTQRFPPALGGVEEHVWRLAHGLSAGGDDVDVVTTDLRRDRPFERLGGDHADYVFPVHKARALMTLPLPNGLGNLAPGMLFRVLSGHWDVLHGHAYGHFPTFAAAVGGMLDRSALVITPHSDPGSESVSKRLFDRVVPSATLRLADRVIALTATEARHLERLGVDSGHIRVIPNGVDLAEFAHIPVRRPSADRITILFVGRLDPRQKGLEYLIRAFDLIQPTRNARLRLVGEDWGGLSKLRSLSTSLGLEGNVEFAGRLPRSDVIRAYATADLFVLPALFEPFGIVLLEAMAAGLPIVASRVGGIPDVVEEGKAGILVEAGNARALAQSINSLISDPLLRERMGEEGKRRAAKYSWNLIVPQIRGVYGEAIRERGHSRAC